MLYLPLPEYVLWLTPSCFKPEILDILYSMHKQKLIALVVTGSGE